MGKSEKSWLSRRVLLAGGAAAALTAAAFWLLSSGSPGRAGTTDCPENLINPSACEGEAEGKVGMTAFREDLRDQLDGLKADGALYDAGIYFRDLRFGPTFGVNADAEFLPMSLMKMPVMVTVLKIAEGRPELLQETVRTPRQFGFNVQLTEPGETLSPDREYTVEQLLEFLIMYSDNKALSMLSDWLQLRAGDHAVADILVDLGLVRKQDSQLTTNVTPRMYASILRILYNASFLTPESSQHALDLMSRTEFSEGIAAGVPDGVLVANKFGVKDDPGADVQLHDCGIVYHAGGPYILCVMTRGPNFQVQADYIQDVSARVYEEMTRRAGESAGGKN